MTKKQGIGFSLCLEGQEKLGIRAADLPQVEPELQEFVEFMGVENFMKLSADEIQDALKLTHRKNRFRNRNALNSNKR